MKRPSRNNLRLRLPRGLLLGLVYGLLTLGAIRVGWMDGLEDGAMDALFQWRGARWPDPRVTIIVADDATVAQVGQWPIPRHVYARVIRRLTQAGVKTIGLDVLFSVPSPSQKDDQELVAACRESGRVIQAAVFHVPLTYNSALPASLTADKRTPPSRFALTSAGVHCRTATWVSSALPELQDSAPGMGHVNVYPEPDGTLLRTPLIRYRERVFPSLALASAAHFLDVRSNSILAEENRLVLPGSTGTLREIPVNDSGESWVNWIGGNDTFPTYNFNQLLAGEVPPVALKDRVVLIGVTAAGAFEQRNTPFSPVQPAVEMQANVLSDILQDRPLRDLSTTFRLLLVLGFPILVGLLVAPSRAVAGMVWILGLGVILGQAALWMMNARDIYVPIAAPLLAGLLTYVTITVANYRRELEANWRVDAAVTALARGGALMASGRERASLLTVIRRTAREVLQARQVFLVLEEAPRPHQTTPETPPTFNTKRYPTLAAVSERVLRYGSAVIWPGRVTEPPTGDGESPNPTLEAAFSQLSNEVRSAHDKPRVRSRSNFNSLLAAPIPLDYSDRVEPLEDRPTYNGVLVAAGKRNGQAFSERDAILLETLAEQAALALENLEYYEILHSRVELANRNLRDAYQALTEERAKLAAAIESNESALIICDELHRAVFINAASARVLLDAAPAIGESVPHVLEQHGLPEFARLFVGIHGQENVKVTGETVRLLERDPQQGATRTILAAQLTPLSGGEAGTMGTMLVVADVTAQRELEQMKDDFVSYVAHELLSPLSTINGYATLLRSPNLNFEPSERESMFAGIEYQCERLNRMVWDLLDLSRMEPQPRIPLDFQEIDLVALGEQVLQNQRAALPDPPLHTLRLQTASRPILVDADPDRVEQILINLMSNAVKYSPEGGTITLALAEQGQDGKREVTVQVTDPGMGMTPEQVTRLFQKYYRTPEAQSRGIKGTGLGLHLTKRLVEAHGGRIEVQSERGCGTTVTVTLPAEPELEDEWVE